MVAPLLLPQLLLAAVTSLGVVCGAAVVVDDDDAVADGDLAGVDVGGAAAVDV